MRELKKTESSAPPGERPKNPAGERARGGKQNLFWPAALCLALSALSCGSKINRPLQLASQAEEEREAEPDKAPSPDICWRFPSCSDFCDSLLPREKERKKCSEWHISRVEKFKKLLDTMRFGRFKDIDPEALKLFLEEIEDKALLFKKFTEDEVKEFLWEAARNPDLASALWRKDEGNFPIARKLFSKLSARPPRAIKEPLTSSSKNFLTVTAEHHNRGGWLWLNGFVVNRCEGDSACEEPLDYYCEILEDISFSALKEFFEEAAFFKSAYRKAIQSKLCASRSCEYSPRGFRQMCGQYF